MVDSGFVESEAHQIGLQLWTTESSRLFIEDEFPWFLNTYDGYKFPIQRVDVVRYFAIRKYGGIYIDMDNVSKALPNPSAVLYPGAAL